MEVRAWLILAIILAECFGIKNYFMLEMTHQLHSTMQ